MVHRQAGGEIRERGHRTVNNSQVQSKIVSQIYCRRGTKSIPKYIFPICKRDPLSEGLTFIKHLSCTRHYGNTTVVDILKEIGPLIVDRGQDKDTDASTLWSQYNNTTGIRNAINLI